MNLVTIYRISDYSNPEKVKPDYASKEDCLRVYVREFTNKNLIVLCDNVSENTYQMVQKYVEKNNIYLTNNGNTGSFLASLDIAKRIAEKEGLSDDTIFYFLEDDYLHRRGALQILVEAFRDLKADYVTLYDHPDKYQNLKDPRYVWGHGMVDIEENGIRKPGIIYNVGKQDTIYVSTSTHWRTVESTTMTWATTAKNVKEDFEDLWKLHEGKPLPMGGTTFRMLAEKGKKLYSPITAYSTHAEEKWMSYFVDWKKESLC
jgi:glycosyltransferase involved in cell wall biosynthesis